MDVSNAAVQDAIAALPVDVIQGPAALGMRAPVCRAVQAADRRRRHGWVLGGGHAPIVVVADTNRTASSPW